MCILCEHQEGRKLSLFVLQQFTYIFTYWPGRRDLSHSIPSYVDEDLGFINLNTL